jgi:tetratricopeptide (TPR) repeat protein
MPKPRPWPWDEDYPAAIDAYTSAIALDPDQPSAYLGRAEAYLGQVYLEQGTQIQGPEDIPLSTREAIIADFEAAATLIEVSGPQDWADSLREQADFLRTRHTARHGITPKLARG